MKEVYEKDLKDPTESGWYLCKVVASSVLYFEDEENRKGPYDICRCVPRMLYWETNVWLRSKESWVVIDKDKVLSWQKVPDEFNFDEEKVKYVRNWKRCR